MIKGLAAALISATLVTVACFMASAAYAEQSSRVRMSAHQVCTEIYTCGERGCDWRRVCKGACSDRYSCIPLYGAYGPYGGAGYWSSYTLGGWFYR